MAISEQVLAELKSKHGDVAVVSTPLGDLAFRTPTQDEHERWVDKCTEGTSSKTSATREYVLCAVVHPSRQDAVSIFEKYGAMPPKIAGKLAELAGSNFEIEIKKA